MAQKKCPKIQIDELVDLSDNEFSKEVEDDNGVNHGDDDYIDNNYINFARNGSIVVSDTAWITN